MFDSETRKTALMSLTFVRVMRRIFGERVEHLILQQRTLVLIVALVVFSLLVTGCLGDVDKPGHTIVTISGTVQDETRSLEFIDVYLDDRSQRVDLTSDHKGDFVFQVPAGDYQLWAWKGARVSDKNGAATTPQKVRAKGDVATELRITETNLHDIHIRTHHTPGHTHIYLTLEPTDFTVAYGTSTKDLREKLNPVVEESMSGPFFKVIPEEPVIGDYSFAKLTFGPDRPAIYAPIFFLELPTITAPKNNASVSAPFTITWGEVTGASDYALYASDPDNAEQYTSIPGISDTSYKVDEAFYATPHDIWLQAFRFDPEWNLLAESMYPVTVIPEDK